MIIFRGLTPDGVKGEFKENYTSIRCKPQFALQCFNKCIQLIFAI